MLVAHISDNRGDIFGLCELERNVQRDAELFDEGNVLVRGAEVHPVIEVFEAVSAVILRSTGCVDDEDVCRHTDLFAVISVDSR